MSLLFKMLSTAAAAAAAAVAAAAASLSRVQLCATP